MSKFFCGCLLFLWGCLNAALTQALAPEIPGNLRDPTEPPNLTLHDQRIEHSNQGIPSQRLELIYYRPGHSFVIIDGKKFVEGDLLEAGHHIKEIKPDQVILQNREDKPIFFIWSKLSIKHSEKDSP